MPRKAKFLLLAVVLTGLVSLNNARAEELDNFELCATNPDGEEWTNSSGSERIVIKAKGRWTGGGVNPMHTPTGSPRIPDHPSKLVAPNLKAGALIMERESGKYEMVGRGGVFSIHTDETVKFIFNDYWDAYADNSGCINIAVSQ